MDKYKGRRPKFEPNERWESPLREIVPNAELLTRYPSLNDIKVGYIHDGTSKAEWFPRTRRILIHATDERKFEEYLQHETEHAIQENLGGPKGGEVRYQGVEGTPEHLRALKRYQNLPGERIARATQSKKFEEFFGLPIVSPNKV